MMNETGGVGWGESGLLQIARELTGEFESQGEQGGHCRPGQKNVRGRRDIPSKRNRSYAIRNQKRHVPPANCNGKVRW